MAVDDPSAQLNGELRHSVELALTSRRPILHHLNADTTWLLQIPRPEVVVSRGGRVFYNILIDPWLTGGQSDVASWFSQQFHATPSAVQSIAELEDLIRESEALASGVGFGDSRVTDPKDLPNDFAESLIDACAVSHEFTDHCHKDTLLELSRDVPVFAIKEAADLISSWKHFRSVTVVKSFGADGDTDWRSTSLSPLPEWIGISRLLQTDDVLNYHSALLFAFNNKRRGNGAKASTKRSRTSASSLDHDDEDESAEAIVYTPHGIHAGDLALIPRATPAITTLAFLHGLHNVRVGTASGRTALQSNLGAHNGLKAQRILNAAYWVGTHDEVKKGGGLIAWFLQRDVISIKDALDQEREAEKTGSSDGDTSATVHSFDNTNWVDLNNGESLILR